jgi:site-specific DNA recombinase
MQVKKVQRVALYARLSVTTDESVSIKRQLEAGRKYAEARGWEVVLEREDKGVSATKNRPEQREGWQAILGSPVRYDAVVVWKVDRLARRALDFLNADAALGERDAALVAVEDPIDMTTVQGRAFATMLAVFAEMEAAAMSARARAARAQLVKTGRRAGGRPLFGYMNIKNPRGAGFVLGHDPDRIDTLREMVARALAGDSIYSIKKWLTDSGVPTPRQPRKAAAGGAPVEDGVARAVDGSGDEAVAFREDEAAAVDEVTEPATAEGVAPEVTAPRLWHEASIETILTSPTLAGMVPYQDDVVRDEDGMPLVDSDLAIITPSERRRLLAVIEARKIPGSRPQDGAHPVLLWGLVRCVTCTGPMYRRTAGGGYERYECSNQRCSKKMGISMPGVDAFVVDALMEHRGDAPVVRSVVSHVTDERVRLDDVEAEISATLEAMRDDAADEEALGERLRSLKAARAEARREPLVSTTYRVSPSRLRDEWARTEAVEERRRLVEGQVEAVMISGTGRRGARMDPGRIEIVWRELTDEERALRDEQLAVLARIGLRPGREP